MSRHVLDHPSDRDPSRRVAQFARIESGARANPASKTLQRRPRSADTAKRLKAFVRIARSKDS